QAGHPSSWPVPPRWERGIRQICAVFDRHLHLMQEADYCAARSDHNLIQIADVDAAHPGAGLSGRPVA
ncbi:MAG: hypothetical protein AB2813_00720, partial [Candidatus Sedimenticola endophacoides]